MSRPRRVALVIRLEADEDLVDAYVGDNEHADINRMDLEATISRALTGDDNAIEGMKFSKEPA